MFNYKTHILLVILCVLSTSHVYGLADPTRPPNYAESEQGENKAQAKFEPILNAVFISGTHKLAVISGKVIKDGGVFEKSTVQIVDQHNVRLTDISGERVLTLFKSSVKDSK